MKEMPGNRDFERFQNGADKYAAYLETPEGRLRLDLAFANVQEFLPQATRPLNALDLGGGTGAIAVRLAGLGLFVTLLDASLPMLDFAKRAAREAGVTEKIALKHGDATQLAKFRAGSFDVILCHNILEYVDDPCAVLRNAARVLRDPSSIISVLVRNQAGEVLKAAIQDGDLAASEHNLTVEWGCESLYGGRVRYLRRRAFRPCSQKHHLQLRPSTVYGSSRITCRQRFPAMMSTSGFLTWSANWAGDRSLSQSPATLIASHIGLVRS